MRTRSSRVRVGLPPIARAEAGAAAAHRRLRRHRSRAAALWAPAPPKSGRRSPYGPAERDSRRCQRRGAARHKNTSTRTSCSANHAATLRLTTSSSRYVPATAAGASRTMAAVEPRLGTVASQAAKAVRNERLGQLPNRVERATSCRVSCEALLAAVVMNVLRRLPASGHSTSRSLGLRQAEGVARRGTASSDALRVAMLLVHSLCADLAAQPPCRTGRQRSVGGGGGRLRDCGYPHPRRQRSPLASHPSRPTSLIHLGPCPRAPPAASSRARLTAAGKAGGGSCTSSQGQSPRGSPDQLRPPRRPSCCRCQRQRAASGAGPLRAHPSRRAAAPGPAPSTYRAPQQGGGFVSHSGKRGP